MEAAQRQSFAHVRLHSGRAKVPLGALRQTGRKGLLPLLVLTQGGANRNVMQEVITEMAEARKADLLFATKLFADLVFKDEEDQQWLERIFAMYRDPLAQTPTYQKILTEGREERLEKGLQEAVLEVVEARFPPLLDLARKKVSRLSTTESVRLVLKAVAAAPDEQAARTFLE